MAMCAEMSMLFVGVKYKVRGYRPDIVQHKSMKMPSSVNNNYQNCNEKSIGSIASIHANIREQVGIHS
jgi:hypothetical protein